MRKLIVLGMCVGLTPELLGCADGERDVLEATRSRHDELATIEMFTWSPWWPTTIPVCFRRQSVAIPLSEYFDRRAEIFAALQETWQPASSIVFTDGGQCPLTTPWGTLEINLDFTIPEGPNAGDDFVAAGYCGYGMGAICHIGIKNNDAVRPTAVHEVGHALGLAHEHPRTGDDGESLEVALCPGEQAKFDAEVADGGTGAGWLPDPTLTKLTKYDPLSIMNYCANENGREWEDYSLTDLDKLGIEMLYPRYWNPPRFEDLVVACASACFKRGNDLLATTNGVITLDWTRRGALDLIPTWTTGTGIGTFNAEYLPVWRLGSSSFSTSPTLLDKQLFNHGYIVHGGGQLVTTFNSEHTAIVSSIL